MSRHAGPIGIVRIVADVAAGKPVTSQTARVTVGELLDDLLTEYKVQRRRSLDDLTYRVDTFVRPYFGDRRCVDITTATVNGFVASRQDAKRSPAAATINRELVALKRAYTLGVRAGKVLHRPYIPMLAERNTRTGFFTDEQLTTVIAMLPTEAAAVVRFAAVTGWRIPSEVLKLQ